MKNFNLLTVLIMLAIASVSFGQTIVGSAHDFSGDSWNTSGELCITCHTPHNALNVGAPLWNHESTTETFTVYSNGTMDATIGQPAGMSKLCLSCHDGVTALDNFGGVTTGTQLATGTANLGLDLSHEHPISFTYNTALATSDGELFDPSTASSDLGGTIDDDMLSGNQMECSSCHDVHNSTTFAHLLVKSNAMSALCLTCHDK